MSSGSDSDFDLGVLWSDSEESIQASESEVEETGNTSTQQEKQATMAGYRHDPPPKFSFKPAEWEDWRDEFLEFRRLAKLTDEPIETQTGALMYYMGMKKAKKIKETFKFTKRQVPDPSKDDGSTMEFDEEKDFDSWITKYHEKFVPGKNIINESREYRRGTTRWESISANRFGTTPSAKLLVSAVAEL